MSDVEQAKRLFRAFHKRDAGPREIIALEPPRRQIVGLEVGKMISLGYQRLDGEKFYHEFEAPRPRVFVTPGGTQILIVGGIYKLTDRGFVK